MRAIVYEQFGAPEVLQLAELPKPVAGPGEILIRVRATTVSAADWRMRTKIVPKGLGLVAALAIGVRRPKHPILGTELAGEVEAIGEGVTRFKVGDRVFAHPGTEMGCYVEYRTFPEHGAVAHTPPELTDEQAASLCFGGLTALRFFAKAGLQRGERVLVNGASGSVGTAAVQLAARHFGAHVTGVCSTANVELVRSLGAAEVVDYTREDFSKRGQMYDVIMDNAGGASWSRVKGSLKPTGRLLLVIGGLSEAMSSLMNGSIVFGSPPKVAGELELLASLAVSGAYRPVIDRRYPLADAVEAHRYVDLGHKKGNVVLTLT